ATLMPFGLIGSLSSIAWLLRETDVAAGLFLFAITPIANSSIGWAQFKSRSKQGCFVPCDERYTHRDEPFRSEESSSVAEASLLVVLSWTVPMIVVVIYLLNSQFGDPSTMFSKTPGLAAVAFGFGLTIGWIRSRSTSGTGGAALRHGSMLAILGLNGSAAFHLSTASVETGAWLGVPLGAFVTTALWLLARATFSPTCRMGRMVLIRAVTMRNTGMAVGVATATGDDGTTFAMLLTSTFLQHFIASGAIASIGTLRPSYRERSRDSG
ncbi:MAG: hypothetical protein AAFN70_17525, partial [Planctomycetota bacterium]